MKNSNLIKRALFAVLVENRKFSVNIISDFFSENYIQYVDGKKITFPEFIDHINILKKTTKNIAIDIKSIASANNFVHTHHIVTANKIDNSVVQYQIFACFQIADNKIIRCDELTRMIQGSSDDLDLGSRV